MATIRFFSETVNGSEKGSIKKLFGPDTSYREVGISIEQCKAKEIIFLANDADIIAVCARMPAKILAELLDPAVNRKPVIREKPDKTGWETVLGIKVETAEIC